MSAMATVYQTHQTARVLIHREGPADAAGVRRVHAAAFAVPGRSVPVEVALLAALRAHPGWLPRLSLVARDAGTVVGHVVCTRAHVGADPVLGLGPIGVLPARQGRGVGSALVHAVVAAAEALDETLVGLLGSPAWYGRLGFEPATRHGVIPPDPAWDDHFQVRRLTTPCPAGPFRYAPPFDHL